MPKAYKTARGEVYEKCGIEFGPEPVAIDDADLATKRGELGFTIGERLERDERLVEVEVPKDATCVKPKPAEVNDGGDNTKPKGVKGNAGK